MKVSDLVLRCYAEREEDGSWFAICLDLNLYSRADNFEEAKSKLNKLIGGYLKEAVTKDAEHFSDLVPRRAPLFFWFRYFCVWCLIKLHQHTRDLMKFKLSLPMVPVV